MDQSADTVLADKELRGPLDTIPARLMERGMDNWSEFLNLDGGLIVLSLEEKMQGVEGWDVDSYEFWKCRAPASGPTVRFHHAHANKNVPRENWPILERGQDWKIWGSFIDITLSLIHVRTNHQG